jgi:hypothetical protein
MSRVKVSKREKLVKVSKREKFVRKLLGIPPVDFTGTRKRRPKKRKPKMLLTTLINGAPPYALRAALVNSMAVLTSIARGDRPELDDWGDWTPAVRAREAVRDARRTLAGRSEAIA